MTFRHGGLTFVRHNEIRDITAEWLDRVCHDAVVEPPLQPLTGENVIPATANRKDDARADIHARVPTILRNGTKHLIPQNTYFAERIEMGPKQLPSLVVII